MSHWKVGQWALRVPLSGREKPGWVRVTKVGRKWVSVSHYNTERRFASESGYEDSGDYSSRARYYANAEEWQAECLSGMKVREASRLAVPGWPRRLSPETLDRVLVELGAPTEFEVPEVPPKPEEES